MHADQAQANPYVKDQTSLVNEPFRLRHPLELLLA